MPLPRSLDDRGANLLLLVRSIVPRMVVHAMTADKPEPCWYCERPSVERRTTRHMDSPGFCVDVCEECADDLRKGDEADRRERLRDGRDE